VTLGRSGASHVGAISRRAPKRKPVTAYADGFQDGGRHLDLWKPSPFAGGRGKEISAVFAQMEAL